MKIEIFGPGCPKCKQLFKNTQQALTDLGIFADLEKVEDINRIIENGIMITPAIAVDGKLKSSGKVLNSDEIKKILSEQE